jgi:thioesterase domain-containing protein
VRSALDDKMPAKPGSNQASRDGAPDPPSRMTEFDAEEYFHQQIPITRAMGMRVVAHNENEFVIEAPVALNSNHLRTAFGGSINAVATLAAYGLLWLGMRDPAVHVVVAESRIRFLRPVRETIRAICPRPSPDEWAAFRTQFSAKGKARITLRATVVEAGKTAAEFEGVFIARTK